MSAEAALVHRFKVGRWSVEISVPPLAAGQVRHAVVEWSPRMPGRQLTASERQQYAAGLREAMVLATASLRTESRS